MTKNTMDFAIEIVDGDPARKDVMQLLLASRRLSSSLYPPESNHGLNPHALGAADITFLVANGPDSTAVGCGAYRALGPTEAEVKSVFVDDAHRRKGIAERIMAELEFRALRMGISQFFLETGVAQPEAINLYKKLGFEECGPFGHYTSDPLSVFLTKTHLDQSGIQKNHSLPK